MLEVSVSVALLEVFGEVTAPRPWHGVGVEAGDGGVASPAVKSGRRLVRSADTAVQ